MSTQTRTHFIEDVIADLPVAKRPMFKELLGIFFDVTLGEDDGAPLTEEEQGAVLARIERERDRFVFEAGFSSYAEMAAAR